MCTAGYPRFPDLRPIGIPIPVSRPNRETGPGDLAPDFPIPVPGRVGNRKFTPSPLKSPFPGQIGNRGNENRGFPGLGSRALTLPLLGTSGSGFHRQPLTSSCLRTSKLKKTPSQGVLPLPVADSNFEATGRFRDQSPRTKQRLRRMLVRHPRAAAETSPANSNPCH